MKNISSRDIKIFIFGMIAMLAIESIVSWRDTKRAFLDGWNGNHPTKTEVRN